MKKSVKRIALIAVLALIVTSMSVLLVACSNEGTYTFDAVELNIELLGATKEVAEAAGTPTKIDKTVTLKEIEDGTYDESLERYLDAAEYGLELGKVKFTADQMIPVDKDGKELTDEAMNYKIQDGVIVFLDENGEVVEENGFTEYFKLYFEGGKLIMEMTMDVDGIMKGYTKMIFKKG